MERLRIDELVSQHEARTGQKLELSLLAFNVFMDEIGKGKDGGAPISPAHQRVLLNAWNKGEKLTRLQPRHVIRIAEFFGVDGIREVIQERRPSCDEDHRGVPSPKSNRTRRKLAITKKNRVNPEEGD